MKNKVILIGSIIAIVLIIVIVVVALNHGTSTFVLENKEDGSINITAENAGENSGGVGEVDIQEGQKLEVKSNLEKEASINVKVKPFNTDNNSEAVLDENFKQTEESEFELPSGNYNVFVTAEKGAKGNMTINVK